MARRSYPWPATRLDSDTVHRLHLHRLRSGKRITVAVEEAVLRYLAEHEARIAPRVAECGERER